MDLLDSITYAVLKANLGREGAISNDMYAFARRAYNKVYRQAWDRFPWENQKHLNVSATTTDGVVYFDRLVGEIRSVRTIDDIVLEPISDIHLAQRCPQAFGNTGAVSAYMHLPDSPVNQAMPTSMGLEVINTSATTPVTVRVDGYNGGEYQTMEVTVAAGGGPSGGTSFDSLVSITKNQTDGDVQVVEENNSSNVLAVMGPGQTQSQYKRIQLAYLAAATVKVMALRRFEPLWADHQAPIIPVDDELVDLTTAELYEYLEDYQRAHIERAKGWDNIKVKVEIERTRSEKDNTVTPRRSMFAQNRSLNIGGYLSPTGWE